MVVILILLRHQKGLHKLCNWKEFDGAAADPTGIMVIRPNMHNSKFAAGVLENILKFAQNVLSCTTLADVFASIKFEFTASSSEGDYDTLHATRLGIYIAGSVWIGWHGFGLVHFWEYCLCRAAARW